MAMVSCKDCGEKVSSKAKACPKCGAPPPKKTSFVTWAVLVVIVLAVFGSIQSKSNLTPEQRREKAEQDAAAAKAKAAEKAAKDKEDKQKGFHCLSGFDGSHPAVKRYVEKNMRDPDSFEHIETRISPVSKNGDHLLVMKYRAKNGFGGMNVSSATATIENKTCKATISAIE